MPSFFLLFYNIGSHIIYGYQNKVTYNHMYNIIEDDDDDGDDDDDDDGDDHDGDDDDGGHDDG